MAKTDSALKPMWRYGRHSYDEAHYLAEFLLKESQWPLPQLRRIFEQIDEKDLARTESEYENVIAELIKRPNSQRPALIRKLHKEAGPNIFELVLLLSVIAAARIPHIVDIRDYYRSSLSPGRGYRITEQGLYLFSRELLQVMHSYEWPYEVFDNLGVCDNDDADEPDFD